MEDRRGGKGTAGGQKRRRGVGKEEEGNVDKDRREREE